VKPGRKPPTREKFIERFWSKVQKSEGCWIWIGAVTVQGYGEITMTPPRKVVLAHRLSYELANGQIPFERNYIDHVCRNRRCVNPAHLEAVTNRTNILRGETVAARNVVKTHCKNGHEFTPENTWLYGPKRPGGRQCRTCYIERARERRRNL
jgi:hypothetical protein